MKRLVGAARGQRRSINLDASAGVYESGEYFFRLARQGALHAALHVSTRVAASNPVMWRDIFLNNRDAVLEMMGRLYEDIALLQKAIRNGDGAMLHRVFTRSRRIRRSIVQAKQD